MSMSGQHDSSLHALQDVARCGPSSTADVHHLRHTGPMDMSHPVLDFPVYGLAGGPDGPRWLDGVVGRLGHPATAVWLGHGSTRRDPQRPWTQVGTFRRDRLPGSAVDADQRIAFDAVFTLVDATMPNPAGRPDDYGHRLVDAATARAASRTEWQLASWTVRDQAVAVTVMRWAGAWAAYTTALPQVDIVMVGFGVEPTGLTLSELGDASEYHFDRRSPIVFPETVERSRAAAGVRYEAMSGERWWPSHADHVTTTI